MTHRNKTPEILLEDRAAARDIESSAEAPNASAHGSPPVSIIDRTHTISSGRSTFESSDDDGIASGGSNKSEAPNDSAHGSPPVSIIDRSHTISSRRSTRESSDDDGIASGGINESVATFPDGEPVQARYSAYSSEAPRIRTQNRRNMGIPKAYLSKGANINAMGGDSGFIGAFDYDKKYPADKYREEMAPEARIWKIYMDEATEDDRFRIENLRDTLDVILVFAGLFSAVVTTFVIHTVESLEEDWQMTTASLLSEMNCIQRSVAAGTPLGSCNSTLSFNQPKPNPATSDYAVNALFFISLAVALCTALAAVLAKQWVHHYLQPVPGSSQDRARKHQFRYQGFTRYQVELIIGTLPILIHASLFLFFIGLVIFLSTLHIVTTVVVVSITGTTLVLYLVSNILPVFDVQCPYHTLLTTAIHRISFLFLKKPIDFVKTFIQNNITQSVFHREKATHTSLKMLETQSIERNGQYLDIKCLGWLQTTTNNAQVHSAACDAFAGLPTLLIDRSKGALDSIVYSTAFRKELRVMRTTHQDDKRVERFARALTHIMPYFTSSDTLFVMFNPHFLQEIYHGDMIGEFAYQNHRPQSLIHNASVYATLYSQPKIGEERLAIMKEEFSKFFISLILHRPEVLDPIVLNRVILVAFHWWAPIKSRLTLPDTSPEEMALDHEESIEFFMKLMDLQDNDDIFVDTSFIGQRFPNQHILILIFKILSIPGVDPAEMKEFISERLYQVTELEGLNVKATRAISAFFMLANLPLPVGDAEVRMFGSNLDIYNKPRNKYPPDDIPSTCSAAFAKAIWKVLDSENGPPPESWEVVLQVAIYIYTVLGLETEESRNGLLELGARLGVDRDHLRSMLNELRPSSDASVPPF